MPDDQKFPIRELCAARVSKWEISKSRNQHSTQTSVDSVGLTRLQPLVIVVLDQAREPGMFFPTVLRGESAMRPKARVALVHPKFCGPGLAAAGAGVASKISLVVCNSIVNYSVI